MGLNIRSQAYIIQENDTYGYCVRRKKWAEIHRNYIYFEGENPVKVDFW